LPRCAKAVTKGYTTIQRGREALTSYSMDETENNISWNDLTFPCAVIFHEKNVDGVTSNPPIQDVAVNSTLNRDFILLRNRGWISPLQYVLIEELVAPVNPQSDSSPEKPLKE